MILPNFISHYRDSVVFAFWRRRGQKREKEEAYVRQVLNCFNSTPLASQDNSPGQPKRSLRAATGVRYSYYVQLVAIRRNHTRARSSFAKEGGVEAAHAHSCNCISPFFSAIPYSNILLLIPFYYNSYNKTLSLPTVASYENWTVCRTPKNQNRKHAYFPSRSLILSVLLAGSYR